MLRNLPNLSHARRNSRARVTRGAYVDTRGAYSDTLDAYAREYARNEYSWLIRPFCLLITVFLIQASIPVVF